MKWERSKFKIALSPNNPSSGRTYGPFGMYGSKYGWTVVHIRTGLNVCDNIGETQAKTLIRTLVSLGDWEFGVFGDAQGGFSGDLMESTRPAVLEAKEMTE